MKNRDHVAFYWDMGTGKTFVGAEKLHQLGAPVNLVVCQKSKIDDWIVHFRNYSEFDVFDLTSDFNFKGFFEHMKYENLKRVGIINYDLLWRRPELAKLQDFTLMLDESSLIQNETSKRSKFILKMQPKNVILLSGTPTGGKYETLWSQMHLLGWNISKELYWKQFVDVKMMQLTPQHSIPVVQGYKNVDRLKRKMAQYGCQFLKTEDVFDLPAQTFTNVRIPATKEYRIFRKNRIVFFQWEANIRNACDPNDDGETELVGDTTLTRMLYERQLCGQYNKAKLKAFADLVDSTSDRLIVFYNFTAELEAMKDVVDDSRTISVVNGNIKDLTAYENNADSITFIQYQAGAMGLNLQKANKMIFFTLPLSSELYEQAKKRIHRIGQDQPCFYYPMICKGTVEEKILQTLEMRKDYTEKLFEKDVPN